MREFLFLFCVSQYGETYDWRLSVPNMETRDHYFTRLKWRIELSVKTEGEKVMLVFSDLLLQVLLLVLCTGSMGFLTLLALLLQYLVRGSVECRLWWQAIPGVTMCSGISWCGLVRMTRIGLRSMWPHM